MQIFTGGSCKTQVFAYRSGDEMFVKKAALVCGFIPQYFKFVNANMTDLFLMSPLAQGECYLLIFLQDDGPFALKKVIESDEQVAYISDVDALIKRLSSFPPMNAEWEGFIRDAIEKTTIPQFTAEEAPMVKDILERVKRDHGLMTERDEYLITGNLH